MDASIGARIQDWLNDPAIAAADKDEIRALVETGDERELSDRFYREMEFGTGGIRGIIGAGPNRLNVYTVGAAAQGLAAYVCRQGEAAKRAGVAVAFDCRRMSDAFARRVASVCAANGVRAYLFDAPAPTPELSFAIRHLGCTAGVVITASHNPPEYNGFKAYWSDGGQVVPPHDAAIIEAVRGVGAYANVRAMDPAAAESRGLIRIIGREVDEAFLARVDESCLVPEACRAQGAKMRIIYSALHGTGSRLIPEALRRRGFDKVFEVAAQASPDGEFSTVRSPNPEEGAALSMAIELAKEKEADLVIATDPDADRVGIAVRMSHGEYRLVTGNQIGALICQFVCQQLTQVSRFPADGAVLSTIVSSDLMKTIARSYGATVIETLTGFKWIAAEVRRFEEARAAGRPSHTYLFGAEESYGYMPATFVRDKDAVTAAAFIADAAAVAAQSGRTLLDELERLYATHGYHEEGARSNTMPGADGAARITEIMTSLRRDPPEAMGGLAVETMADLQTGEVRRRAGGQIVGRYELSAADVLVFTLEDQTKVIARPSGTEPKIKYYILAKEPGDDPAAARRRAAQKIDAIAADLNSRR
jgi:phosphoglucomutase